MVAGVVVGRAFYGLTYRGLWLVIGIISLHLLVLPRLAAAAGRRLDHRMLVAAQQGRPEDLARAVRAAWLVRLYAPRWYVLGRWAWAASEAGRHIDAERLYERAIRIAKEPERTRFRANLSTVKRRLGKADEADALRRRVARDRPDLARALEPPPDVDLKP